MTMTHTREEMMACSREELLYLADQQAYARARYPEDDSGLIRESIVIEYALRLAASASDGVQTRIPDGLQCNEQSGKQLSRAAEMLHIASTMILAHCPEETYFYDGTDCDGICIADDCLSARESLLELADTHRTDNAESTPPAVFSDPVCQPHESGER